MTMCEPTYGERYAAHYRALEAKRRMDAAMEALCVAEAEWIAACHEADRMDGADGEKEQSR